MNKPRKMSAEEMKIFNLGRLAERKRIGNIDLTNTLPNGAKIYLDKPLLVKDLLSEIFKE